MDLTTVAVVTTVPPPSDGLPVLAASYAVIVAILLVVLPRTGGPGPRRPTRNAVGATLGFGAAATLALWLVAPILVTVTVDATATSVNTDIVRTLSAETSAPDQDTLDAVVEQAVDAVDAHEVTLDAVGDTVRIDRVATMTRWVGGEWTTVTEDCTILRWVPEESYPQVDDCG